MKILNIKNYFISAVAGTSAILVRELTNASTSNIEGFIYSVLAGVATFILLNAIFHLPSTVPCYRRWAKVEEKFAGDWIETVIKSGKTFYTLFSIVYIWNKDVYIISGLSLDENGSIHADWESLYTDFDNDLYEVKFLFRAREKGRQVMTGYAELKFFRGNGYKPCEGKGFFVDMNMGPIRVEYEVQRIDKSLTQQLLGSKHKRIKGKLRKEFIKRYHDYRAQIYD